jgi:glycosyltransferase involved in cell wall biosynthesis
MSATASPDPDRIVLVDPGNFTPPYDVALARALEAAGRKVRLVGRAGQLRDCEPLHYGHFYPILASRWGNRLPGGCIKLIKGACHGVDMLRLVRWATAFEASIAHFQWSPLPAIDRRIIRSLRHRMPVILTWHDSNPYQGAASWVMRKGYADLLRGFDAVIVHTRQAQRRAAAMGVDPSLIYQIPHGLLGEPNQTALAPARPAGRDRLVLLQFGKIKPYKGVDLLLEALALVPQALRERLDVRIVGKPYMDTAAIERFVHENGLAGCVTLRFEFVSEAETERLFIEADIVVLPYREIDASGVAMTAVARGIPVLATAIDGFRELFEQGGGARLVPPGNAAAMSEAIIDWLQAPERVLVLAGAMHARRAQVPSWIEIARLHLAVYQEARARWVIGGRPGNGQSAATQAV